MGFLDQIIYRLLPYTKKRSYHNCYYNCWLLQQSDCCGFKSQIQDSENKNTETCANSVFKISDWQMVNIWLWQMPAQLLEHNGLQSPQGRHKQKTNHNVARSLPLIWKKRTRNLQQHLNKGFISGSDWFLSRLVRSRVLIECGSP